MLRNRTSLVFAWGLSLWLLGGTLPSAPAQEPDGLAVAAAIERALVDAIATAEQSVVSIARVKRSTVRFPADELPRGPLGIFNGNRGQEPDRDDPSHPDYIPTDFGSGVVIGVDPPASAPRRAYILTNYHVVKGGTRAIPDEAHPDEFQLYVRIPNRRGYSAAIFAADPRSDLAVITINDADVKPIKMGDGSRLRKGQLVIALGNPYAAARDGSASASWGMVSNLRRRPGMPRSVDHDQRKRESLHDLGDLIQVDTRLNLGTSGGALVNLKGELVGLTTALAALVGFEKSSGFAVPIDSTTMRVIQSLREGKEVEYGFLGVSFGNVFDRGASAHVMMPGANPPEGAYVVDVVRGGPAEHAGIQPKDVILNVNGERVFTRDDLTREINKLGPDARTRITVWRHSATGSNSSSTIDVALTKWGAVDEEGIVVSNYRFPAWRGLVVDYATARDRHNAEFRTPPFPTGALILKILTPLDSLQPEIAEGARIIKVNQRPVATPADFMNAVKDLKGDVTLELDIGRENKDGTDIVKVKQVTIHE